MVRKEGLDVNIFGTKKDNVPYVFRPGVYGLIYNQSKNKIAIIETGDGKYFLPGGGLENNETHEECIRREGKEEIGVELVIEKYIGIAQGYFYSSNDQKYYLSEGHFYLCSRTGKAGEPTEEDHFLRWMEPAIAKKCLLHEHQRWAVDRMLAMTIS